MTHHGRSPGVLRALSDFGAEQSFERASCQFKEHYGYEIGRTSTLRVVHGIAQEAEIFVEERLREKGAAYHIPVAKRPGVGTMVVQLDGCEIRTGRMKSADNGEYSQVRKLPKRRRVEAWREVRVGLARPLEESQKTYVAGMRSYEEMGGQLFDAAVERGLSDQTQVVAVSDGGHGLREQLDTSFPGQQFILDRPHFKQHLFETADEMSLEGNEFGRK